MRSFVGGSIAFAVLGGLLVGFPVSAAADPEPETFSTAVEGAPELFDEITVGEEPPVAGRGAARAAENATITFSEVPLGTAVTDQYVPQGIQFGGDAPFTLMDASSASSPVLSGSPAFRGSITGTFVDQAGQPRPVANFFMTIGYIDTRNSVAVDIHYTNQPDETVLINKLGFIVLAVGGGTPFIESFRIYEVGTEPAGFAIDNVTFTALPSFDGTYVALGDSFQSGEGAYDYESGTDVDGVNQCHRSENAYPHLLVEQGVVNLDLDFKACSGALIEDIYDQDPSSSGPPWNEPGAQLGALDDDTRLVTIGVGGNDLDFSGIVSTCVLENSIFARPCESDYGDDVDASLSSLKSGDIRDQLLQLYRDIRERAPYARVVVVSYPMFFSTDKDEFGLIPCAIVRWADGQWMNSAIKKADRTFGDLAKSVGFEYVNMDDVLLSHEQCTDEPGINPPIGFGESESFHPNELGHELMADRIQGALAFGSPTPTFEIEQGQTVVESVQVAADNFWVNVGWPGSDVQTTLISPSGVRYDRATPRDSEHGNGPTYEYFAIENPELGEWTVELYGADIAVGGEPVTFTAGADEPSNAAPTAAIEVTEHDGVYTFDAAGSTDADGSIASYEWDFGDGTYGTGAQVSHTFAPGGTYYVMLQVTDDDGDAGYTTATDAIIIPEVEPGQADHYFADSVTLTNQMALIGNVTVDGDFTCNSEAEIDGDLLVTGTLTMTNNCEISGNAFVGGSVDMTNATSIGGVLEAQGNVLFHAASHIGGDVTIAGTFASRDGLSVAALQGLGALGGAVSEGAQVTAPSVEPPSAPTVELSTATSWQAWVNAIATANNAPSWSQGLTANPGCTIAPWPSSVNGTTISVTAPTVVDATGAVSSCGTVGLQQMQIQLGADLTLVVENLSVIEGLSVTSADGNAHNLTIVVPGQLGGTGAVSLPASTVIASPVSVDIWATGLVTIGTGSTLNGSIASNSLSGWGDVTVGRQ
jgi:lysophospholipase L1-like esterase/chitodextrinase